MSYDLICQNFIFQTPQKTKTECLQVSPSTMYDVPTSIRVCNNIQNSSLWRNGASLLVYTLKLQKFCKFGMIGRVGVRVWVVVGGRLKIFVLSIWSNIFFWLFVVSNHPFTDCLLWYDINDTWMLVGLGLGLGVGLGVVVEGILDSPCQSVCLFVRL